TSTRCETAAIIPWICGESACVAVLPMRPSFSERRVSRCLAEEWMGERTWVSLRSAIARSLLGGRSGRSLRSGRLSGGRRLLLGRFFDRVNGLGSDVLFLLLFLLAVVVVDPEHLPDREAAQLGDVLRLAEALDTGHRGLDEVDRVLGADRL